MKAEQFITTRLDLQEMLKEVLQMKPKIAKEQHKNTLQYKTPWKRSVQANTEYFNTAMKACKLPIILA